MLLFDGACGFCRAAVSRWQARTGGAVDYEPYQERGVRFPEVADDALAAAVHLVEPDGSVTRGAEAVFRCLAYARGWGWLSAAYRSMPGFRPASELAYRLVARNRGAASAFTHFLCGRDVRRPEYRVAAWLFLRGMALIYLIAFLSLRVQVDGLVGADGIWPAASLFEQLRERLGDDGFSRLPSLCWWDASDASLRMQCGVGAAAAVLLLVGVLPVPMCFLCWALYLSLTNACGIFLGYQWENLLLEAGFLAILVAPLRLYSRLRDDPHPSRFALFLVRFLLFKLMFLSGYVKLASQDKVWWDLSAVTIHYWTQPIPAWTAWFMHHAPAAFNKASCFIMFVIELGLPFLIFLPRRPRTLAFAGLFGLQVLIAATGNFAYFNYLSMVLCLPLLDDSFFPWRRATEKRGGVWPRWFMVPVGLPIFLISAMTFSGSLGWRVPWPDALGKLYAAVHPYRSVSSYGLFANMTEDRPEIIVEGSDDGQVWKEYEFKWKPGALDRRPGFVAPHQPRLDWQMWFAALGDVQGNPWFVHFMVRLLQGSPPVLDLVEHNPFPDRPPRVVRAMVYDYYYTTPQERRETGAWWRRELRGPYCPPMQLRTE